MRLTRISLDDWEGIYSEDGKIICQGHRVDLYEILEQLGHSLKSYYLEGDDLDEFGNHLPDRLEDILEYIKNKK